MRPIGHIFDVSADVGQRTSLHPKDLAERHWRKHNNIIQSIHQDQVRAASFDVPGILKVVSGKDVYYAVVEKIQDAKGRYILAAHSMVFSLDTLANEMKALLPPLDEEAYKELGIPSVLHSGGRKIKDIEAAIEECVDAADVQTCEVSPGWNTRELNWLLSHRWTEVSDPRDDFSPEDAVRDFLMGIHPAASAQISFAVKYAPRRNFNITAHSINASFAHQRDAKVFRAESDFRAAVEATRAEEVMRTEEQGKLHYKIEHDITGKNMLDILPAFRNGLRDGKSHATMTANLLANAISDPDRQQRALEAFKEYKSRILDFPDSDKETIRKSFAKVSSSLDEATSKSPFGIGVATALTELSPRRPAPVAKSPEPHRQVKAAREGGASPSQGASATQKKPQPTAKRDGQSELEDPQELLDKLTELNEEIMDNPYAGIQMIRGVVLRFIKLVMDSGDALQNEDLSKKVEDLWGAIHAWREKDKKERRKQVVKEFMKRENPNAHSLFEDLIHITVKVRGDNKKHEQVIDLINEAIDLYKPSLFRRRKKN